MAPSEGDVVLDGANRTSALAPDPAPLVAGALDQDVGVARRDVGHEHHRREHRRLPPTGAHGDQLVTTKIVLPEKVDDEMSYFFSEWKQKHQYNPGRD